MIIQGLMDFVAVWLAGVVGLIPPFPPSFDAALTALSTAGGYFGPLLAKLSPVFPWDVFSTIVQSWLGAMVFFVSMLALRLGLFLVGR